VNLAVLAATLVDVVDFFPVTLPVRRQQVPVFRAGPGVLPVAAGFFVVAMTVIPLFCSRF
jgi:hypothetical protein